MMGCAANGSQTYAVQRKSTDYAIAKNNYISISYKSGFLNFFPADKIIGRMNISNTSGLEFSLNPVEGSSLVSISHSFESCLYVLQMIMFCPIVTI